MLNSFMLNSFMLNSLKYCQLRMYLSVYFENQVSDKIKSRKQRSNSSDCSYEQSELLLRCLPNTVPLKKMDRVNRFIRILNSSSYRESNVSNEDKLHL